MRTGKVWLLVVALTLGAAAPLWATEFRTGQEVTIETDEVIDDDLFVAGSDVLVAGHVTGDVIGAGGTVCVTGRVDGSVMAAAADARVTGEVSGSVRAAGQNVTVSADVGRNVMAAGDTVMIEKEASVGRDVRAAGRMVSMDGGVGHDADLRGATATVRGRVGRNLRMEGEQASLGKGAQVDGDLVYRAGQPLEKAPGAVVAGEERQLPPSPDKGADRGPLRGLWFGAMVLVFGLVGIAALPRLFLGASNAVPQRPGWNLVVGLAALVGTPVACLLVMATLVGIPLGALTLVLYAAALAFSAIPVAVHIGRWLAGRFARQTLSPYLALVIGLVVLGLLRWIPIVGWIVGLAVLLIGLGVYARAAKGLLVELRRHPA